MPHTHTWPLSIHNNTTMHVLCALHRECLYRLIYRMEHIWYVPFGRSAVCLGVWVFGVAGFIWLLRLLMFDSLDVWHSAHVVSSMYVPPVLCVCVCVMCMYTHPIGATEKDSRKGLHVCCRPDWLMCCCIDYHFIIICVARPDCRMLLVLDNGAIGYTLQPLSMLCFMLQHICYACRWKRI